MCFGKKWCQSEIGTFCTTIPQENNYCGGFALAAVLTDCNHPVAPLQTYCEIQALQRQMMKIKSASNYFIQHSRLNETAMSLPSSIALRLQLAFKDRRVCVSVDTKALFDNLADNLAEQLIAEELQKLTQMDEHVKTDVGSNILADHEDATHFIVLVNNAQHWVAVKKETTSFTCYDPSNGQAINGGSLEAAVAAADYSKSPLVIALSR